jgi:DNA-binding response OmpR family regulator
VIASSIGFGEARRLKHGIIFEPDPAWRPTIENALASLYWTVTVADSLADVADLLPGPWAAVLAIESGDVAALESVRALRKTAPDTVLCVLVDELSPDFDRQLLDAGVDAVFAKPVQENEIVEALVDGFMRRRGQT